MIPALGVGLTSPTDDKVFTLGEMAVVDGKAYIYIQANGAITGAGYVVSWKQDFDAIMTDTDTAATVAQGRFVGVAPAAFSDNQYGWVQVYGACSIRSEQDALANGKLGPTADGGQVDDAGSVGAKFFEGMYFGTATGGADGLNTTGFLNWPQIQLVGTYA